MLFKPEERGHEYWISSVVFFALLLLLGKPLPSNHCVQLVHPIIWHYCLYEGNTEDCKRTGNQRDKTPYVILLHTVFSENLQGSAFREMTRQLVPLKSAFFTRGHTIFCSHIFVYKNTSFSVILVTAEKNIMPGLNRAGLCRSASQGMLGQ